MFLSPNKRQLKMSAIPIRLRTQPYGEINRIAFYTDASAAKAVNTSENRINQASRPEPLLIVIHNQNVRGPNAFVLK
jgi:hypothetical protein